MAKYTPRQKLSKQEETKLIIEFCNIVSGLKNTEEAILFTRDLLSTSEIRMLSKRLKIARMLIAGFTYEEISKDLNVSSGTIARINIWLNQSGEGYRMAISKAKEFKEPVKPRWTGIKRKYPMYYWPEILLKEIVFSANKRQKNRLQKIIDGFSTKDELMKELNTILKQYSNTAKY